MGVFYLVNFRGYTCCFYLVSIKSISSIRIIGSFCFIKGLKGQARIPTDDLIPKIRRCRNQHSAAFQTRSDSKIAVLLKLSETGMTSLIFLLPMLKCHQMIVCLSLLLL